MARVHILGNSIAYGFGVEDRSWPALIRSDTNRRRSAGDQPRITTVNLASPGNMLSHVLQSGLFEASVECNRRGRQIGLFSVGACEASILRSRGETVPRRTKSDFSHDLDHLAAVTEKLNSARSTDNDVRLIFMSTIPVNDEKSSRTPEGDDFNGQLIQEYNAILKDHTDMTGARYVDLYTSFDKEAMLSGDGIHPNHAGDTYIYTKLMPALLEELGIDAPTSSD